MRISAQKLPWLISLLLTVLLLAPLATQADELTSHWELRDGSGGRWGLVVFEQPDPAYPSGWRLRLMSRNPELKLDHVRSLQLDDSMGGQWQMANRSEELVPKGDMELPDQAAQFDVADLWPRPQEGLPLRLLIPLMGPGDPASEALSLVLGPEPVTALHEIPE